MVYFPVPKNVPPKILRADKFVGTFFESRIKSHIYCKVDQNGITEQHFPRARGGPDSCVSRQNHTVATSVDPLVQPNTILATTAL